MGHILTTPALAPYLGPIFHTYPVLVSLPQLSPPLLTSLLPARNRPASPLSVPPQYSQPQFLSSSFQDPVPVLAFSTNLAPCPNFLPMYPPIDQLLPFQHASSTSPLLLQAIRSSKSIVENTGKSPCFQFRCLILSSSTAIQKLQL